MSAWSRRAKDLAVLSSSRATEQERLEALKYLGHWVGDVHQSAPRVLSGRPGWQRDRGLRRALPSRPARGLGPLHHRGGLAGDAYSIARDLLDQVTDKDRATWLASTPVDWANESFALSLSPKVGYCVRTGTGCWYAEGNQRLDGGEPKRTVVVDRAYIETYASTVGEQLVKTGLRLAGLLNQALSVPHFH